MYVFMSVKTTKVFHITTVSVPTVLSSQTGICDDATVFVILTYHAWTFTVLLALV
jgi:hypothetical protein